MRRSTAVLGACISITATARLRAEPAAKPAPAEHRVEFRADQVEVEADTQSLDLQGNVVIQSERFRLSGDRLALRRSPRGVHVDGSGVLGLCPCKNPPIAFGMRAADLAPPSDVLLASATLRVFGVPVFWWPYLWLRSPNRAGVLPPFVTYRGEEGLLLGSGVHVPLGDVGTEALDVSAGAYVRKGARVEARLKRPGAYLEMAFDQFHGSALDVRSNAASAGESGAFGALRLDWLAGARGQRSVSSLERAILPSDRFRAAVGRVGNGVFGLTLSADAQRSALLGEFGAVGPGVTAAIGGALSRRARYAVVASTESFHQSSGDAFIARFGSELHTSALLGPLVSSVSVRDRVLYASSATRAARELFHESRARLSLPLARRYRELLHTLKPFAEAALQAGSRAVSREDPWQTVMAPSGTRFWLLGGLSSALGTPFGRDVGVDVVGGVAAERAESAAVFGARARADASWVRMSVDTRALPDDHAADALLRAELGRFDSVRLGVRVEGMRGDVRRAIGIFSDDFLLPVAARLDRSGWSSGAELEVPWGDRVSSGVGTSVDLSHSVWLATWGQVRYRHPCRCMSLALFGSRRTGRRGVDIGLNLELIPR
jgi:hypothetical protein